MTGRVQVWSGILVMGVVSMYAVAGAADSDGDGVDDGLDVCCQTPEGVLVDAEGRPVGDHDLDCDVDLDDYAIFHGNFVDLEDFAIFQRNFTGPLSQECPLAPFAEEFLAEHNAVRAQISAGTFPGQPEAEPDLPPLVWDAALAAAAQDWADCCDFSPDPNRVAEYVANGGVLDQGLGVGVNLFATTALNAPPSHVVSSWVAQAGDYDHATNTCSDTCDEYTQVVWDDTTRVGCAKTRCQDLIGTPFQAEADIFVCYYYSAGNFPGQPYETMP